MKAFVPAIAGARAFFVPKYSKIKTLRKEFSSINEIKDNNMITPTYQEIKQLAKDYSLVPICKEIYADIITPITLLRKISDLSKKYFLLESIEGGERWGRYSFIGFDPITHITCKNKRIIADNKEIAEVDKNKPYSYLRSVLSEYKAPRLPDMPPFMGGFVGYFSYEMIGYTEPELDLIENECNDYDLMLFDKVIVYDHLKQKIIIVVNMSTKDIDIAYQKAIEEIYRINSLINEALPISTTKDRDMPEFTCNVTKEEFCEMVDKVKGHILRGDIFQAVISRRYEAKYKDSLLNAYRALRTMNPSPYMVYMQIDEMQLISASPETLIKLQDNKVLTFPIAGSRPRGRDRQEDESLRTELLADEKELSEHNMLVDLARNDIGKISVYGKVKVSQYQKIHKYSRVMHITSEVEGELEEDKDAFDALEAVSPAGTLSGAPRIKACEIIGDIEGVPRGVYGGAIGYIDFTGNMDTCIAIRMALKLKNKVYVQAGAGIVADCIAEREYEETENKARALIEAIQKAREVEFL